MQPRSLLDLLPGLDAGTAPCEPWRLAHAWSSAADRDALALCAHQLEQVGLALLDARPGLPPHAIKMHGMELVEARQAGTPPLQDLAEVAAQSHWARTVPAFMRQFMQDGPRWHGIPMDLHRANAAWVNDDIVLRLGGRTPTDMHALLAWMAEARRCTPMPLAVGAQPWQVGLLFESVVLAVGGAGLHAQAFAAPAPAAWLQPGMLRALQTLMALRAFVDDASLHLDWAQQLDRVRSGRAAMLVMGDWARRAAGPGVREWAVPGTVGHFTAIADFFVPLAGAEDLAQRAARALTRAAFQRRFAARKGCLAAIGTSWGGMRVLPCFTMDQCCPTATRRRLLDALVRHFVAGSDAALCARALAEAAAA